MTSAEQYEDLYVWFKNNYGRQGPVDPEKRWQFLVKALMCQMDLLATLIEEQAAREERGPKLLLPTSVQVRGDLTRLG